MLSFWFRRGARLFSVSIKENQNTRPFLSRVFCVNHRSYLRFPEVRFLVFEATFARPLDLAFALAFGLALGLALDFGFAFGFALGLAFGFALGLGFGFGLDSGFETGVGAGSDVGMGAGGSIGLGAGWDHGEGEGSDAGVGVSLGNGSDICANDLPSFALGKMPQESLLRCITTSCFIVL